MPEKKSLPEQEIRDLYDKGRGLSIRELSKKYKVSRSPIVRIISKKKNKPGPKSSGISKKEKSRRKKLFTGYRLK